ncbi:MAG: DUF2029 domain-containing protein, partial [Bdellovibrionales bacterium]|nr:DUF2029 domain-containing protein [Bdellovibrionales bacterium]
GALLALQRTEGRLGDLPAEFLTPPWFLICVLPLSTVSLIWSFILWRIASVLLLGSCSLYFISTYSRSRFEFFLLNALAISLLPMWQVVEFGQLSALLLLGMTFLHASLRQNSLLLAVLSGAFLSLKPQLTFLVPILLIVWFARRVHRKVAIGYVTGFMLPLIVTALVDSQLMFNWFDLMSTREQTVSQVPVIARSAASLANRLRFWIFPGNGFAEHSFVAIALCLAGGIAFLLALMFRQDLPSDEKLAHIAVVGSLLATPYVLFYDFTLLLPALLFVAVRSLERSRFTLLGLLVATQFLLFFQWLFIAKTHDEFWWYAVAVFFLIVKCRARERENEKRNASFCC